MSCPASARLLVPLAAALLPVGWACGGGEQQPTPPDEPEPRLTSIEVTPPSAELNALGATRDFDATARDQNGNPMSGVSFSWSMSPDSVGSVDGQGTATAEANGSAAVEAEARGVTGTADLTVDQEVAEVSVSPDSGSIGALGDTLDFDAPLRDANGNPVTDVEPTWTSDDTAVATVDSEGRAVARAEGRTEIEAEAGGARGSGQLVVRDTTEQAEANLTVGSLILKPRGVLRDSTVRADGTVRNTGDAVADAFRWRLGTGGAVLASGEISGLDPGESVEIPTQSDLGPFAAGAHRLTLEADVDDDVSESSEDDNSRVARLESFPPGFEIELQFVGELSDSTRSVVRRARDRWERVVTGDLVDITPQDSLDLSVCFDDETGVGQRTETIDDVLLLVRRDSIDGVGGSAGVGGFCFFRIDPSDPNQPPFSLVGRVTLDTADVDQIREDNLFDDLVLHEIGHALMIGGTLNSSGESVWSFQGGDGTGPWQLLEGDNGPDPTFLGPLAIEEFLASGGDSFDGDPVPAANTGGENTRDGHWRESVLGDELMTSFLNAGENPLSTVTIASLADQFYAVDMAEGAPYQVPVSSAAADRRGGYELGDHVLNVPLYGVDEKTGTVRVVVPPDGK